MQRKEPQLAMKRKLEDLPEMILPEGYILREFKSSDVKVWEEIVNTSFETDFFKFDEFMKADAEFKTERILFICYDGKPVATASAWFSPTWGEDTGFLHVVGVLPSHSGKGLGYSVSLAALHKMKSENREYVVLNTDDFRIPAIKTYLKLGFVPLLDHENQRERWNDVFKEIGKPELSIEFKKIIEGPIYKHANMKWTEKQAWDWYSKQPWFIGFNYVPSNVVNSCAMWQEEYFDKDIISKELKLANSVGFNSCRIFLQYMVWKYDREGFMRRLNEFLDIAASMGIKTMPIIFDDCNFADYQPVYGPQPDPIYGIHNSCWVPSPGDELGLDKNEWPLLESYVKDIIKTFGNDERVNVWDIYNEPGNCGMQNKTAPLLSKAYGWARECNHIQPLTSGIWSDDDIDCDKVSIELSDIISFHRYDNPDITQSIIDELKLNNRPIFCTEWLHRPMNSNVNTHIPLFKKQKISCYNWGLICGKTQTNLNWSTMRGEPDANPKIWQHDLFFSDATSYNESEIAIIKNASNDKKIYLHPVNMTLEVMEYLEEQELIIRLCPGGFKSIAKEGQTIGKTIYESDIKNGGHKLISVTVNRDFLEEFGTHDDNEEFLLIGNAKTRQMYLVISLLDKNALNKKIKDKSINDSHFITLIVRYNDPLCSFFTMLKEVPHGEMVKGDGEPATFFVTEPSNMGTDKTDFENTSFELLV